MEMRQQAVKPSKQRCLSHMPETNKVPCLFHTLFLGKVRFLQALILAVVIVMLQQSAQQLLAGLQDSASPCCLQKHIQKVQIQ